MPVAFLCSQGYQEPVVYSMEELLYQTDYGMHKHRQKEEPVHWAHRPRTVIGKESD